MASIFTYDPDPPRVSSPWLSSTRSAAPPQTYSRGGRAAHLEILEIGGTTRLDAEPQEGPTEYKLHLLLRPRRSIIQSSTGKQISGSQHSRSGTPSGNSGGRDVLVASPPSPSQSAHSRQHRLEQLTTQLLWRLQQSSPYHASSATNLILPSLPEATLELKPPKQPAKLLPGLEESSGALYEIGVADDGTLVGLAADEMEESLNNLRAMAASLGCVVEVLRRVTVGDCEWLEIEPVSHPKDPVLKRSKLFVAEAYVRPELGRNDEPASPSNARSNADWGADWKMPPTDSLRAAPGSSKQLRVTLTGPTTCGKSSLLGTLSTSTLDNGRGTSRLSLLKHRHEIASGMTSSLVQELIGYGDETNAATSGKIYNYASPNINSWSDVHAANQSGRLVMISDSAGHPRYRRTTVRGLIGWAPHWTLLCISATTGMESQGMATQIESDAEPTAFSGAEANLSMAHLELCLRLHLRFVVVITKLDATTRAGLRTILSSILSSLKAAGRAPVMLRNDNTAVQETDLQHINAADLEEIQMTTDVLDAGSLNSVPILLTSAVKGIGIAKLHGLLRFLPIPDPRPVGQTSVDEIPELASLTVRANLLDSKDQSHQPRRETRRVSLESNSPDVLFHVEDVYNFPGNVGENTLSNAAVVVVGGHLAYGEVSVGQQLMLGPFSASAAPGDDSEGTPQLDAEPSSFLTPRSFNDAFARTTSSPKLRMRPPVQEWRRFRAISVRNLRLPVQSLHADHVGTIGVVPVDTALAVETPGRIRKGMVLINGSPRAAHTFTASFDISDAGSVVVGTLVVVYCASVRASAKVVAVELQESKEVHHAAEERDSVEELGFNFDDLESETVQVVSESISATFQFITYREWVQVGAQVLIMPGGGPGLRGATERGVKGVGGLEGFVGTIVDIFG